LGKPLTSNKLHHIVNDHINKKHKLSQKQQIYNSIKQYIENDIDDNDLSKAMPHYIGN
jgi:acid stress-induced BolA-like protein IbaG/YrbA